MLLEPGRLVGAYEILEPLGHGGMGEVYRARHTQLGRIAAIKLVSDRFESDPDATERLKREARLASSLNHPAIVTIHDIGEIDGRPFIVMEFVDGKPLSEHLAAGALDPRDAVDLAAQVADGLAAAHSAGVVHRDLKPHNIMVTSDGRAKIVDFGLSKLAPQAAGSEEETYRLPDDLTMPHTVLGTIGYMAPEQLLPNRQTTFHTDQFALGVVLYEMLTGKRAFKRDSSNATIAAILEGEPDPITQTCPTLSPRLVAIIERCLAKRPEHRYGSTRDLEHDLTEVRDQATSGSRTVLPPFSLSPSLLAPWLIRHWRPVVAVALTVALAGAYYRWGGGPQPGASQPVQFQHVAVLPFTCGGSDQVFCDGLMETLTSGLAELSAFDPKLRVVPQAVLLRDLPADRVGAEAARSTLGATVALNGAVERHGSGIRVTITAIDATNLAPGVWARARAWWSSRSQSTDVPAGQEAKLQRAVVSDAAALLHVKVTKEANAAIDAGGTTVAAAFVAYARGRGYLHRLRPEAAGFASLTHGERTTIAGLSLSALTAAVTADPNFALAHVALCEAQWREYERTRTAAQIEPALASCRSALQLDGNAVSAHLVVAQIARGRGRHEEAIASATQAVALAPWSAEARSELAAAHQAQEQWDQVEAVLQDALRAWPDDPTIYGDLCRFYTARRLYGKGEPICRRAVDLTPDSTRTLNNLGATLLGIQANEEAVAKFKYSLEVRPTFAAAYGLGYYYYQQGSYSEAARAYQQAVALLPATLPAANKIEVYRAFGTSLYWTANERPNSRAAYEQVVQLVRTALADKPKNPATLLGQLADAYSLLGRKDEARAVLDELARLDVNDAEVLFLVAGAYEQSDDRTQALKWLERAIAAGYSREKTDRSPFLADLRKDARYANVVK